MPERARLTLRCQQQLKDHYEDLAKIFSEESGTTFEDAKDDVRRSGQAASVTALMMENDRKFSLGHRMLLLPAAAGCRHR
ncbi:hypothetical protein [Microbulbifer hainanensis]|uniref:hypothetical protein n=1 Tax=Microbulbifer hainanensis TaxID=2735675 RepID=UPI0038573D9C